MINKKPLGGVVCHYCHNSGHVHRDCRKLQNRDRMFQYANESLKSASTPSIMLASSGKPNSCLISSSSKWVIDSRATDHMTCNSSLHTTCQPHPNGSCTGIAIYIYVSSFIAFLFGSAQVMLYQNSNFYFLFNENKIETRSFEFTMGIIFIYR